MSISATLSVWNDVEIAIPGAEALDAPLDHGLRLLALELDRELARLQLVHQLVGTHSSASSRWRPLCRLEPCELTQLLVARAARERDETSRRLRAGRASRRSALRPPCRARRSARAGRAACRSAAPGRASRARRCRRPAGARRPRRATVVPWKPRSPTQCCAHACGQPSRCSRSSAIWVPKRSSRRLDQPAEPRLRLGDREVAMRLARARDRVAAHRVDRRARSRSARAPRSPPARCSFGTPVTMKFCWRVRRMSPP